ncbi:MAG: LPS export ABC transporter permease LptG [Deltaproteobacteria bacterium]|jgi:lipopolysaccharide export system permease protein|nr:LPS export ABC transporter permease LptG [Deltaproteobacteria bacterium]
MKTLSRYISVRLGVGWLLVFLILTSLFSFLELVGQLDDIGKGSYHVSDAFMYVLYTLPGRALDLAAVCSLIGAIVGLGTLANSHELLSMRACGVSVFQIAGVVLKTGSVIMLGVLFLAQFVVPPLEQQAKINREISISGEGALLPTGGFWTRDQNRLINIRTSQNGVGLAHVSVYEFDDDGKPTRCVIADDAKMAEDGRWVGTDVRQVLFQDDQVYDRKIPTITMDVLLNTRQIDILKTTPDVLSLDKLFRYIQVLQDKGQNADQYVLSLWQKTTLPIKVGTMILFALPFVFGSAREANPGRRLTLGTIVGIAYYYFEQSLGYMGLLIGLHPAFTTLMPLAIIALLAKWFMLRVP